MAKVTSLLTAIAVVAATIVVLTEVEEEVAGRMRSVVVVEVSEVETADSSEEGEYFGQVQTLLLLLLLPLLLLRLLMLLLRDLRLIGELNASKVMDRLAEVDSRVEVSSWDSTEAVLAGTRVWVLDHSSSQSSRAVVVVEEEMVVTASVASRLASLDGGVFVAS